MNLHCSVCRKSISTSYKLGGRKLNITCHECRALIDTKQAPKMRYCIKCLEPLYPTLSKNNRGGWFICPDKLGMCDTCKADPELRRMRPHALKTYIAHQEMNKPYNRINVLAECLCHPSTASKKVRHHFDYDRPLDVWMLCTKCHGLVHSLAYKQSDASHSNGSDCGEGEPERETLQSIGVWPCA